MTSRLSFVQAVIANGASLSGEVDLTNHRIVAIHMPAAWSAAAISFAGCILGDDRYGAQTFDPVHDDGGTEVSITTAASRFLVLRPTMRDQLTGLGRVKLRSGLVGAAVNQAAARTLTVVLEPRASNT